MPLAVSTMAERVAGDPRVQALSDQLNSLDKQFGFCFFTETRRSWVMSLPTESGEKVVKAFCASGLRDETALELRLRAHCMQRWRVLASRIIAKGDPMEYLKQSSEGSGVFADPSLPSELDEIPKWYENMYEEKVWKPRQELIRLNDPSRNPARTWRLGMATQVFGASPRYQYYPGGEIGRQIPRSSTSKRMGVTADAIRTGELYMAPADESASASLFSKAIEEPGVFAGFSAVHNLPNIEADWPVKSGYTWCPLRVRMDLDRVYRMVVASGSFTNVRPYGSGGGPFKEKPWEHMSPYKIAMEWRGASFQVGITDEGRHKTSSSGARLWISGKETLVSECFSEVVRLLPQSDFDDSDDNHGQCILTDGQKVKWCSMSEERVMEALGLPEANVMAQMTLQQQSKAAHVLLPRVSLRCPWGVP